MFEEEEEKINAEIRALFAARASRQFTAAELVEIDKRAELFVRRIDETSHLPIDEADLGGATAEAVEGLDDDSLDEFVRRVNAQVVGDLILKPFE